MKKILSFLFLFATLLNFLSCNGEKTIYLDMQGMNVKTGELSAYDFSDGMKGELLVSVDVDKNIMELRLGDTAKPILIELTKASFRDLVSGETVTFTPNDKWTTIITPDERTSIYSPYQINPLTTLGAAIAEYRINYFSDKNDSIKKSKEIIGDHFKTDLDLTPVAYSEEEDENIESLKYYLAIGGLSQLAEDIEKVNTQIRPSNQVPVNRITDLLIEDIKFEGLANGISSNGKISLGLYFFSEDTLKSDLVAAIRKFMSLKQIPETLEINLFLENILRNDSQLFVPENSADMDNPQIRLVSPQERSYVNGIINIKLEASDKSDIAAFEVKIKPPIDNQKIEILNKSFLKDTFEGEIDSSEFLEGPLLVIAKATDRAGLATEKIFVLFIDKFAPTFTTNIQDNSVLRDRFEIVVDAKDSGSSVEEVRIKEGDNYYRADLDAVSGLFKTSIDTLSLPEGHRNITIKAMDKAKNASEATYDILINNRIINHDNFVEYNGSSYNHESYDTEFVGLVNNDGIPDIATSISGLTGSVKILFGNAQFDYLPSNSLNIHNSIIGASIYKSSISAGCDINDDNHADVVAGLPFEGYSGRAYAFFGPINPNNQWKNSIELSISTVLPLGFGYSTECMDANGDQFDDIIVTSKMGDEKHSYIFFGPDLGYTLEIKINGETFGGEVYRAGDINGDSLKDFIIGNRLIYGSTIKDFSSKTDLPDFASISPIGDYDKDGDDDLLIGNPHIPNDNGLGNGIIKILNGGEYFISPGEIILPPFSCSDFGSSVSAGDIDGNGHIDLVASSPHNKVGDYNNAGQVFVFLGPNFEKYIVLNSFLAKPNGGLFGAKVKSGFDINLDGRDDLIVIEPGTDSYQSLTGSFHVMFDTE